MTNEPTTPSTYETKFTDFKKALFISLTPADKIFADFLDVSFGGDADRLLTDGEREAYDALNKIEEAFWNFEELLGTDAERKDWRK